MLDWQKIAHDLSALAIPIAIICALAVAIAGTIMAGPAREFRKARQEAQAAAAEAFVKYMKALHEAR